MKGHVSSFLTSYLWPLFFLFSLAGITAGIGFFTFVYAKGASYLSNRPEACANCHIMNSVYEGWTKGGHQHVATCNDCHVPHGFFGKWYTKADNGFHHSWAFTFLDLPVALRARKRSQDIVQANCVRCHGSFARPAAHGARGDDEGLACKSCHREIGHPH